MVYETFNSNMMPSFTTSRISLPYSQVPVCPILQSTHCQHWLSVLWQLNSALLDGFDPKEPDTKYEWLANDVNIQTKPLKLDVNILVEGKKVKDEITIKQEILSKEVNFGSYNLIKAIINNKGATWWLWDRLILNFISTFFWYLILCNSI